jgi:high affinity sulfate transporter 1
MLSLTRSLARLAPGLAELSRYRWDNAPADIRAGVSVAAVAIPVAIAYAELAGFPPQVGLYSSILPLIAYAVLGSSRQLIVGPDAATCTVVAAAVAPLAAGDAAAYASLSMTLAALTGLICIAASFFRLGALADFLSKPILVGFLNGVALSIVLGQAGKILGFAVHETGIVPQLAEIIRNLGQVHLPTLAVAICSFTVITIVPRFYAWLPGPLVGLVLAGAAVPVLGLADVGVRTLGVVSAGLPGFTVPQVDPALLPMLFADAAGLALVSFSSLMLTARSFASKNGYEVDSDQDFAALGVANVVSALSQGFAISGADSRTAINDATGGRTRAVGLVAAVAIAAVLLFLTEPLQYVPTAALGAVLVVAGLSLVDIATVRLIYRIDRTEAVLSVLATLGVVAVGAVNAILLVVVLALLRFIKLLSRPSIEILGKVEGYPGLHSLERHGSGQTIPGLLLMRFNAPITFFNAPYFKREVLKAADEAGSELRHVVLDLLPIPSIDATGLLTLIEVVEALRLHGVDFNAAGRATEWRHWAQARGFDERRIRLFPTLRQAVRELSADQSLP